MKRRKRLYSLKTCLPSGNPYTPTKSWLARVNRTKTWLTKVQTCLSRENVPRKGGNAFYREERRKQRQKIAYRAKTWLPKAETRLHSSQRRKHQQMWLAKLKKRLPSEAITFTERFPSENVTRKGENAFIERKRRSQRR